MDTIKPDPDSYTNICASGHTCRIVRIFCL